MSGWLTFARENNLQEWKERREKRTGGRDFDVPLGRLYKAPILIFGFVFFDGERQKERPSFISFVREVIVWLLAIYFSYFFLIVFTPFSQPRNTGEELFLGAGLSSPDLCPTISVMSLCSRLLLSATVVLVTWVFSSRVSAVRASICPFLLLIALSQSKILVLVLFF